MQSTVAPPDSPVHLNAAAEDFTGNDGRGRFLLLPGSRGRAQAIAEQLENARTKSHPRGHDLHLGNLAMEGCSLDVGVISTGMGCPSIDLIATELLALGARVLLRVGTCGSLQPDVRTGDLIVATAAVRDEATSDHYLPREFPALASWPLLIAAERSVRGRDPRAQGRVHFGPVHTKDSLYARELRLGPKAEEHARYEEWLRQGGILGSEMECAHLFVLGQLGARAAARQAACVGAVLAVIGDHDQPFADKPEAPLAVAESIQVAFGILAELRRQDS